MISPSEVAVSGGRNALVNGQQEDVAAAGVAPPTGDPGIPLEPTTLVWVPLTKEQREVYEAEHHTPPPGYRATGEVHWFQRSHPDTAPCACGALTDRFHIRETYIGSVPWAGATYFGHALCGVMVPVCADCTRRDSIVTLERRQLNLEILERVRVSELRYLTELKAELNGMAA